MLTPLKPNRFQAINSKCSQPGVECMPDTIHLLEVCLIQYIGCEQARVHNGKSLCILAVSYKGFQLELESSQRKKNNNLIPARESNTERFFYTVVAVDDDIDLSCSDYEQLDFTIKDWVKPSES